jgi:hypothetical protein
MYTHGKRVVQVASSTTLAGVVHRVTGTVDRKWQFLATTSGRNEGVVDSSVIVRKLQSYQFNCGSGNEICSLVEQQEGVENGPD